jgi:hypothetical protein
MNYNEKAQSGEISKTIEGLKKNGITAVAVSSKDEVTKKVLELIPEGSEVMTMTSVTLDTLEIAKLINESGKFNSVRNKLNDKNTPPAEKKKLGAAPDYAIGSVHAVTENGEVFIASNTGSQLPAYAYGANHVVWVVGTQKIVADKETAMKRIYEYVLPLEAERAKKAYGAAGSNVSKLLVVDKEVTPNRINIIFVDEVLGF